jgi:tRNA (mo5U34)-methyltransferase
VAGGAAEEGMTAGEERLEDQVRGLGTWFHNLHLDGIQTAPDHPLGDFPAVFWAQFERVVPRDLSGWTVLDIGCNAGFYSFELKRRGADRVLGVDHDPGYLAQARFARDQLGLDVEFRRMEVYSLDELGDEQFDLVLFMGVFYHLRHPLLALEKVVRRVRRRLIFQTLERGSPETLEVAEDYPFEERAIFADDRFPRLYFVEKRYAGDPTNWWIPNAAASQALLRSAGLRILDRPCREVYLCEPDRGDPPGAP